MELQEQLGFAIELNSHLLKENEKLKTRLELAESRIVGYSDSNTRLVEVMSRLRHELAAVKQPCPLMGCRCVHCGDGWAGEK